ncbi:unnamed protein product [Cyprideis torosa]|uniref:Uncharacterized protein n=1 Tax=Cyprideis torosa TaxID=163714 RepID=A0A7R8W7H5_9CRUS|nr:unnamed protein product [Cyprideis torosa]CAG0882446.1 unnamed protein product [Cyprideis torosa]
MPSSVTFACGCCGIPLIKIGKQPPEGWAPPQGSSRLNQQQDMDIGAYRQASVARHNFYRKKHASPPLKHDEKLNDFAQEWATNLAGRNQLTHRPDNKYGENLYYYRPHHGTGPLPPERPLESWYREIAAYENYYQTGPSETIYPRSGYVVANYDPKGNNWGEFPRNVIQQQALLPLPTGLQM